MELQYLFLIFMCFNCVACLQKAEPAAGLSQEGELRTEPGFSGEVLFFIATDCPIANAYAPEMERIWTNYRAKGFSFYRVYAEPGIDQFAVARHGDDFSLSMPAVIDPGLELVRKTGVRVTPEAAVFTPDGRLAYRGRIDNRYLDFGKQRKDASRHDLRDALEALLAEEPIQVARTDAVGCFLPIPDAGSESPEEFKDESVPSFGRDIAPLIHGNCSPCHNPGGSAPFALLTYEQVAGRASQIEAVTKSRYMPPWKPVSGFGDFVDARGLTEEQVELLSRWVQIGAPLGDPNDLSAPPRFERGAWRSEPDLVLEMSEPFQIPAEGIDVWRSFVLPSGQSFDRPVASVEFIPSNLRVVHHLMLYVDRSGGARKASQATPGVGFEGMFSGGFQSHGELAGWVPGMAPYRLPAGLAWWLPKNGDVVIDTHFQTTGRPEECSVRVGFTFAEEAPRQPLELIRMAAAGLNIPAGTESYVVTDQFVLPEDVQVVGIIPHAHFICRDVSVSAILPGGESLPLIWIRDWDFNWQDLYRFRELVSLPRGTRIEMRYEFDNSSGNERNPHDPPRRVIDGPGSLDEMATTWLQVTLAGEEEALSLRSATQLHFAEIQAESERLVPYWTYMVSAFDADSDGSLDQEEEQVALGYLGELWSDPGQLLEVFDLDKDGVLSESELQFAQEVDARWKGESGLEFFR